MATVVNLQRDTRAGDFGAGLAQYLSGVKDKRLDGLQQELLNEIANAEDEATAAAVMADPRFADIMGDPVRFPQVTSFFDHAKPGQETIIAYNAEGEKISVSYNPKREKPEDVLMREGLNLDPKRTFYKSDPNDPEAPVAAIPGIFATRADAAASLPEEERDTATILDETSANIQLQASRENRIARQSEDELAIRQALAKNQLEKPHTQFAALVADWQNGDLTDTQFQEAWARIVTILGRSQFDVSNKLEEDLRAQAASVESMSVAGIKLMEMVIEDPGILTRIGAVSSFVENVGAELEQVSRALGVQAQHLGTYEEIFERIGFAEKSDTFKRMILDFAIITAKANGVLSGNSFSDKDFDRTIALVGGDLSNPDSFINNMQQLITKAQGNYNIMYSGFHGGVSYEDAVRPFTKITVDDIARQRAAAKKLEEVVPGFEPPPLF